MFRRLVLLCVMGCISDTTPAQDVGALLKAADQYRLPADAVQVKTRILLYKNGALDKMRQYNVYIKPGRRSLVIFRHASEMGQKLLMLDDKFWIVMPKSRRPIRITPMQKLLGEASAADIATMTWSEDYAGKLSGEVEIDGVACQKLDLSAARKGVTYKRIELYLDRSDHRPVKADLFVASGKLAKQAYFTLESRGGRDQVVTMTLLDEIQRNKKTVIEYLSNEPRSIADKYYNPMFLVRNTLDGL